MPLTLGLAIGNMIGAAVMGGLVAWAALAAGCQRRLPFWLGGTLWGMVIVWLRLSDCLAGGGQGPLAGLADGFFWGGALVWPVVMVWGQPRTVARWRVAQLILLAAFIPFFVATLVAQFLRTTL